MICVCVSIGCGWCTVCLSRRSLYYILVVCRSVFHCMTSQPAVTVSPLVLFNELVRAETPGRLPLGPVVFTRSNVWVCESSANTSLWLKGCQNVYRVLISDVFSNGTNVVLISRLFCSFKIRIKLEMFVLCCIAFSLCFLLFVIVKTLWLFKSLQKYKFIFFSPFSQFFFHTLTSVLSYLFFLCFFSLIYNLRPKSLLTPL